MKYFYSGGNTLSRTSCLLDLSSKHDNYARFLFSLSKLIIFLLSTNSKIFPPSPSAKTHDEIAKDLHAQVYAYLLDLIEPLDPSALLASKAIIKQGLIEQNNPDAVNVREATATINQFIEGVPSQRFGEIARKERRHKL